MIETLYLENFWVFLILLTISGVSAIFLFQGLSSDRRNRDRIMHLLTPGFERKEKSQKLIKADEQRKYIEIFSRIRNWRNYARIGMLISVGFAFFGDGFDIFRISSFAIFSLSGGYLVGSKIYSHKQKMKFRRQFPQFLDILIRGGQAGHSLEQICAAAVKDLPQPIKDLVNDISSEVAIGHPIETVILQTSIEKKLPELHFLAVALSIQRRSGGQYSEILSHLRDKILAREEHNSLIKSLTAEGRTAAAVVVVLTVLSAVALVIFSPDQFTFLISDPTGKNMLSYCLGSVGLGFYCIHFLLAKSNAQ